MEKKIKYIPKKVINVISLFNFLKNDNFLILNFN